jgi:hypothetical protein
MRFDLWFTQILIAFDQLFHVLFSGPHYLMFGGELPKADETISSRVGRSASKGFRWALIAERLINRVFSHFGEENHCRSRIRNCRCDERYNNQQKD